MATFILIMLIGFVVWFIRSLFAGMSNAKHWAANKASNVVDNINIETPRWWEKALNKAAEAEDTAKTVVESIRQNSKR